MYWSIVQSYPHPELLKDLKFDDLAQKIINSTPKNISLMWAMKIAKKLLGLV
ncbi:hypothetical protein HU830_06355 [Lactobacillus sp. DCY120]|uniref:Uncharacterized protein n=1 Tax=Bombilactobacillus apium TaxID=2675299 RepID=A0A850RBT8_9LACO|nr:hypothetical protein [Bombilactobacillus apium]NVY96776.1 hypothetical protein [Bombilactobacillus apium]